MTSICKFWMQIFDRGYLSETPFYIQLILKLVKRWKINISLNFISKVYLKIICSWFYSFEYFYSTMKNLIVKTTLKLTFIFIFSILKKVFMKFLEIWKNISLQNFIIVLCPSIFYLACHIDQYGLHSLFGIIEKNDMLQYTVGS